MQEFVSKYSKLLTYAILVIIGLLLFLDMEEFFDGFDLEIYNSIVWDFLNNMLGRGYQLVPYIMLLIAYVFLAWKYEPKIEKWLFSRRS